MLKKILYTIVFAMSAVAFAQAQATTANADTVLVLPFENISQRGEFNWVGESFADSLSDLLKVPSLNVVSNDERKIIQQRLRVPLTSLPSLATSLKLAREGKATLLIAGKYNITPAQGEQAAIISVTAKIIRVNEGRFLSEEFADGRRITRDIYLNDALQNLQTVQGQVAYQILYQRDKALPFAQNQFVEAANKVPARAFEAYIKGLLASESDPQTRENYLKNAIRIYAEEKSGATFSDAALELGHLFLNQRKFPEAVDYFSRVPQESQFYPEAAFYTGLIHWQQQNYEQALAVLRPLAEDLKLTSVYNTIGAIAVQASRAEKKNKGKSAALLTEGIELLKKALDSSPDESNVRFNYSLALFLNLQYAEAAQELRPMLASNPKDGESYFLLAKTLELLKDASAADFDNQARRFLTDGDRYAKLQTEWSRARTADAIGLRVVQPPRKDFVGVILLKNQVRTVQTPINETETLLAQARQFYKDGRDDDAMAVLRRVLVSEPMSAESYYLLGMIHLRRGDKEQSVSSLKTALFWDNRLINAYIALVKIYIDKNDCLQAKNYMTSGLEVLSQLEKDSSSAALAEEKKSEVEGLQRLVERCSTK
ncbi:MAG TPA: tetratricopeptide repeat protein [Pyrinomonadaceae bacterium]|jgi:cytochrome c-type biogenesis protein CcmH/NrfG/TolB-like protein